MPSWISPDYSNCSNEDLIKEYESVLKEIQKRFSKRKTKKIKI